MVKSPFAEKSKGCGDYLLNFQGVSTEKSPLAYEVQTIWGFKSFYSSENGLYSPFLMAMYSNWGFNRLLVFKPLPQFTVPPPKNGALDVLDFTETMI